MQHTISVLLKNESGVLSRVVGLFSARGNSIGSLSVAKTMNKEHARATIVTSDTDDVTIVQIVKQLMRIIPVIDARDVSGQNGENIELVFVKLEQSLNSSDINALDDFNAKLVHENTVQAVCTESELANLLEKLKSFGIKDVMRSGSVALV